MPYDPDVDGPAIAGWPEAKPVSPQPPDAIAKARAAALDDCEAIARAVATTAKEQAGCSRTLSAREAWTEQKISALHIAGLIAALKRTPVEKDPT